MQSIKFTIKKVVEPVRLLASMLRDRLINVLLFKGLKGRPGTPKVPKRILFRRLFHWLHVICKDVFWILIMLTILYFLNGTKIFRPYDRVFPMWFNPYTSLWEGPIEFSYPHIPMVLNTIKCAVALLVVPLTVILVMQLFVRSFWDWTAATVGLFQAMALMTLLQCSTKQYIGAFRPYFLTACNPDIAALNKLLSQSVTNPVNGHFAYHRVFTTTKICNPTDPGLLRSAMISYPSGHTGSAFTAGVFLALYLNAKLKSFSDYKTSFWKMIAVSAPIIGAMLVAAGLTIDHNHHGHDILLSVPIGVFCAVLAYRAHYLSLFSYQTNHIPLYRSGLDISVLPPVLGQSVLHPAFGAALPVGKHLAVKWPKSLLGDELPLSVPNSPNRPNLSVPNLPNLPGSAPDSPASVPNLPTRPSTPNLPSAKRGLFSKKKAATGDGTTEDDEQMHARSAGDAAVARNEYHVPATPNGDSIIEMDGSGGGDFSKKPFVSQRRVGTSDEDPSWSLRVEGGERGEQMV